MVELYLKRNSPFGEFCWHHQAGLSVVAVDAQTECSRKLLQAVLSSFYEYRKDAFRFKKTGSKKAL